MFMLREMVDEGKKEVSVGVECRTYGARLMECCVPRAYPRG
jgi:hypothetical protein